MRVIAGGLACAIASFACADSSQVVFPFPPNDDRGTEILTFDDGATVRGFAIDLTRRSFPLSLSIANDETAQLEALIYDEEPSALALEEGPLEPPATAGAIRAPDAIYRATMSDGELGAWALSAAPSEGAKRFAPPLRCVTLEIPPPLFGSETTYTGGAAVSDSAAILFADSSTDTAPHCYLADATGVRRIANVLPRGYYPRNLLYVPNDGTFISAFGSPEGDRVMFHGDLERGFVKIAPRPDTSRCGVSGMDYARSQASTTLYTIDRCGNIDRYFNGAWTSLVQANEYYFNQRIAWAGPDELVFFSESGLHLRRYRGGQTVEDSSELPIDQLVSLETVDGFGTYAGMASGWVLKYNGSTWTSFRPPFISTVGVTAFGSFGGNLLVGGSDGDLQHWVDSDACPETTYVGVNHFIADIIPLKFGIVVAGVFTSNTRERLFFGSVLRTSR